MARTIPPRYSLTNRLSGGDLTIHWSLTEIGDDPDGTLFAKFREGLNKWLYRLGVVFAAAWSRERQGGGQSDVVHCHLLFHLPLEYRTGAGLIQTEAAIHRLIKRHGRDISDERVIKLVIHDKPPYPDGKYLLTHSGRINRSYVRSGMKLWAGKAHGD